MSRRGYNKGRGNLKKVIFHRPNTGEAFEYIIPLSSPEKKKVEIAQSQTQSHDLKLPQPIELEYFKFKEDIPEIDFTIPPLSPYREPLEFLEYGFIDF